jgi:hypothetical protein
MFNTIKKISDIAFLLICYHTLTMRHIITKMTNKYFILIFKLKLTVALFLICLINISIKDNILINFVLFILIILCSLLLLKLIFNSVVKLLKF